MTAKKRNDRESRNLKARMEAMKMQGRSGAEIARELGVTRQYVSQVLIQSGLAGRRRIFEAVKFEDATPDVIELIARLEQQGQLGSAVMLREIFDRGTRIKDGHGNVNS